MGLLSALKEKITQYVDVYVKLFKINFIGHTASLLSYFMFAMIGLFMVFCILLLAGLGITEAFVAAGLAKALAFLITIGIYLLLLFILFACRKMITRFFAGIIIGIMTESDEEDKEDDE